MTTYVSLDEYNTLSTIPQHSTWMMTYAEWTIGVKLVSINRFLQSDNGKRSIALTCSDWRGVIDVGSFFKIPAVPRGETAEYEIPLVSFSGDIEIMRKDLLYGKLSLT